MDSTLKFIFQIIGVSVTAVTILAVIIYVIYHKVRDVYDKPIEDQYGNRISKP